MSTKESGNKDLTSSSRMIFTQQEPRWSIYADRLLALSGIIGSCILIALLSYEWGVSDGIASIKCKSVKTVRMTYDTEELSRMLKARRRMESIK